MSWLKRNDPVAEAVRRDLEERLRERLTMIERVLTLGQRLDAHRRLLEQHRLELALAYQLGTPALFLSKSYGQARVEWRNDYFRLVSYRESRRGNLSREMEVDLTSNLDLAEATIVQLLEDNRFFVGSWVQSYAKTIRIRDMRVGSVQKEVRRLALDAVAPRSDASVVANAKAKSWWR